MTHFDLSSVLLHCTDKPYRDSRWPQGGDRTSSWKLLSNHTEGYLAPVITLPRPDAETGANARHRNCFTGQPHRHPVSVLFGRYPFYFELTAAPAGLTIGNQLVFSGDKLIPGPDYGVITGTPVSAGTYTVSGKVTDQNDVVTTFTYQLVVGTSNWVVLDKNAGTNGSGTLASPYNTEASLSGQSSKCVLVRAGTVNGAAFSSGLNGFPRTWVPYSGETVNWKVGGIYCNSTHDLWFSGFNIFLDGTNSDVLQWFLFDTSNRVTFFENTFDGDNREQTNASQSNSAVLFWANQHVALNNSANSFYTNIIGNKWKNLRDRDLVLGYSQQFKVVENNELINYQPGTHGISHGFYEKTNVQSVSHRRNYGYGSAKFARWDAYNENFPMDYLESSYNSYQHTGTGDCPITLGYEQNDFGTHRYIFRNSIKSQNTGGIGLMNTINNAGNLVTISNNVIMSPVTTNHGITIDSYNGQFTDTGNINGNLASGLLDVNNLLTSRATPNLGTAGAEVK